MNASAGTWLLSGLGGLAILGAVVGGSMRPGETVTTTVTVDDARVPDGCVGTRFVLTLPGNRATWAIAVACPGEDEPTIKADGRI